MGTPNEPGGAVLISEAVAANEKPIAFSGEHEVRAGSEVYVQPYVYLSHHVVQMRAAGWPDADFDTVAAVSGGGVRRRLGTP